MLTAGESTMLPDLLYKTDGAGGCVDTSPFYHLVTPVLVYDTHKCQTDRFTENWRDLRAYAHLSDFTDMKTEAGRVCTSCQRSYGWWG